jgi:adenylate cyclase class IV
VSRTSFPRAPYEVEFRCRFASDEEAFAAIPWLHPSLTRTVGWTDAYYGVEVFERGEVLRFSSVILGDHVRFYLSWKGVDLGAFANLRQELAEEVTDGTGRSEILATLADEAGPCARGEIVPALEAAGHDYFMSYEGESAVGRYEPLSLSTKVMRCDALRWPLLVELEKLAATEDEAHRCEEELLALCRELHLEDRVVREEPGTLLYEKVFGSSPRFLGGPAK